ncbi:mitochondrial import receptor subunit TOM40 homolog [Heterodontus francisci]|uniref:mitochondrial import receptor subunit TOM40 homolog n=1 Tax=Heterodontus francisci TaxID=7792 RepID=UPI00355ACE39
MGNVLAAGSPVPGFAVPPGFSVPPVPGPEQQRAAAGPGPGSGTQAEGKLPNPGTFEECHRKCKELFPIQMEGVKLVVNKGLSNHFQVNHTVSLSTLAESSYHFGATYVGTKQLSPTEAFPVLVGDMDNMGSLNAQLIHQLTNRVRSKMVLQSRVVSVPLLQLAETRNCVAIIAIRFEILTDSKEHCHSQTASVVYSCDIQ